MDLGELLAGLLSGQPLSEEQLDSLASLPLGSPSGGGLPGTRPAGSPGLLYRLGQLLRQPSVLAALGAFQVPLESAQRATLRRGMRTFLQGLAKQGSAVWASRKVITEGGLQGGGDLSADRTLALTDTGVAEGSHSYPAAITVDKKGRITAITVGVAPASNSRQILAGTGLSGGGDLSADRTLALAASGVTAGSYSYASITVDAQGRITVAASGTTPAAASRQILAGTGLSGGGDLSADRTLALGTSGVTAGSYTVPATITVDAYGRLTAITSGSPLGFTVCHRLMATGTLHAPARDSTADWVAEASGVPIPVTAGQTGTLLITPTGTWTNGEIMVGTLEGPGPSGPWSLTYRLAGYPVSGGGAQSFTAGSAWPVGVTHVLIYTSVVNAPSAGRWTIKLGSL